MAFFLKKLNNPITYAVAMCASGLAFIILPYGILDVSILILGALISTLAACLIAAWALSPEDPDMPPLMRQGAIFKSSAMLAFGVMLMLVRSSISRSVCTILGILLALYSIFRLSRPSRNTVERGAAWYIEGVILVSLIMIGSLVSIIPFMPKLTAGIAMLAFGAKLIYDAATRALRLRRARRARQGKSSAEAKATRAGTGSAKAKGAPRRAKRAPRDIYSTDFVDRSDKKEI